MVFCGESIITEISVYVFFYMSEFIIQSTYFFINEHSMDFYSILKVIQKEMLPMPGEM